jgi:hypothetical protein
MAAQSRFVFLALVNHLKFLKVFGAKGASCFFAVMAVRVDKMDGLSPANSLFARANTPFTTMAVLAG